MKLITSLVLICLLASCASNKAPVALEPVKTTITVAPAPKPSPVSLKPVEFKVVTEDTSSILKTERVWYAISVRTYENLAFNTQEMLRVIREQRAAIQYYEGLYLPVN
jgi:hypothetical protein